MSFFTDPLRITLLIAGVIVIIAIYFFGRRPRPKLDKRSLAPENRAVHPSEYQHLDEQGLGVGEVRVIREPKLDEHAVKLDDVAPMKDVKLSEHTVDVSSGEPAHSLGGAGGAPSARGASRAEQTEATDQQVQAAAVKSEPERQQERFIILHIRADDGRPFKGRLLVTALEEAGLSYGVHKIFHYEKKRGKQRETWFSVANMVEPGIFDLEHIDDFQTRGISLFMRLPMPEGSGVPAFTQMMACAQRLVKKLGGQLLDENHQPLTVAAITQLHKDVESYDKQLSLI